MMHGNTKIKNKKKSDLSIFNDSHSPFLQRATVHHFATKHLSVHDTVHHHLTHILHYIYKSISQHVSTIYNHYQTFSFNTLRTGDADLRFYVTTVQDG